MPTYPSNSKVNIHQIAKITLDIGWIHFSKNQTIAVDIVALRVVVQARVLISLLLERSVVRKVLVSDDGPGMVWRIQ